MSSKMPANAMSYPEKWDKKISNSFHIVRLRYETKWYVSRISLRRKHDLYTRFYCMDTINGNLIDNQDHSTHHKTILLDTRNSISNRGNISLLCIIVYKQEYQT